MKMIIRKFNIKNSYSFLLSWMSWAHSSSVMTREAATQRRCIFLSNHCFVFLLSLFGKSSAEFKNYIAFDLSAARIQKCCVYSNISNLHGISVQTVGLGIHENTFFVHVRNVAQRKRNEKKIIFFHACGVYACTLCSPLLLGPDEVWLNSVTLSLIFCFVCFCFILKTVIFRDIFSSLLLSITTLKMIFFLRAKG